jgi:hypothetical protein
MSEVLGFGVAAWPGTSALAAREALAFAASCARIKASRFRVLADAARE